MKEPFLCPLHACNSSFVRFKLSQTGLRPIPCVSMWNMWNSGEMYNSSFVRFKLSQTGLRPIPCVSIWNMWNSGEMYASVEADDGNPLYWYTANPYRHTVQRLLFSVRPRLCVGEQRLDIEQADKFWQDSFETFRPGVEHDGEPSMFHPSEDQFGVTVFAIAVACPQWSDATSSVLHSWG